MAAYLIADVEVVDSVGYDEYRKGVPATIAAYGGRYLARGGATEALEGKWAPKWVVILEFPTVAQLKAWYDSPEYRPLRVVRERTANSSLIIIEGL